MSKTLLASILRQPEPASVETDALTSERASDVLATWRSLVPASERDGNGDKEDFWEMAYRLHAAVHSGAAEARISIDDGPSRVVNPGTLLWEDEGISAEEAYKLASTQPSRYALYGPVSRFSPANVLPLPQETMATLYASLAPYSAHSGRHIDLVSVGEGYEGEDAGVSIQQRLREYRDAGITRAAVKSVSAKRFPLTVFDLAPGDDPLPEEVADYIAEYAFQLMGRAEAFILQGYVDMRFEYRMFVIGGKVVTGGGSIEEFTPLDSDGRAFSPLMRQFRKQKSAVVDETERLHRYIDFSSRVASEFAEQAGLVDYVLDVATDGATGEPLIVELNGLLNSGLFASDPTYATRGLVR